MPDGNATMGNTMKPRGKCTSLDRFDTFPALWVVLVWFLMVAQIPRLNQRIPQTGRGQTIGSETKRINTAKNRFIVDHRSQTGDPVTLEHLFQDGYLVGEPPGIRGVHFIVGNVGEPVGHTFVGSRRSPCLQGQQVTKLLVRQ